MKCFRSKRIYKNNVKNDTEKCISDMTKLYNQILHYSYNQLVLQARHQDKVNSDSLYNIVKRHFKSPNIYLQNTAVQDAKAVFKSQKELRKMYTGITEAQINKVQNKLKQTVERKKELQDIKDGLKAGSIEFKKSTKTFKINEDGSITVNHGKGKSRRQVVYKNYYDFECMYLRPRLKELKSRVGWLIFKINRLNDKLNKLSDNTYISSVTFGSKKFLKCYQQFKNDPILKSLSDKALNEYRQKRNYHFNVSGRKDSGDGNFAFAYDGTSKTLYLKSGKNRYPLSGVSFPYGQEYIDKYYAKHKKDLANFYNLQKQHDKYKSGELDAEPITFEIEDHNKYYIVKCMVNVDYGPCNYSKSNGVIAIDTNLGFYSVSELDEFGNLIGESKDYHYDITKSSNAISTQIECEANKIIRYAAEQNKPVTIESLKMAQSAKCKDYGTPSRNFTRNVFAHKKMIDAIKSSAEKYGVAVIKVNPAYTSFIAMMKYIPVFKRSIHQLAAYVIGRRAMFGDESIPKRFKAESWKELYNIFKKNKNKTQKVS